MGEGLVQFLFVLAVIIFSVVDAASRKGKRKRKMDEMEREEARASGKTRDGGRQQRDYRRTETADRTGSATREPRGSGEDDEEERVTADQLVPEDLWAILTGQAPTPREPPSPERSRPSGTDDGVDRSGGEYDARGRRSAEEPPQQARIPEPVPSDRMGSGAAPAEEGAEDGPTRRSGRWMEGVAGREEADHVGGFEFAEEEARIYAALPDPWGAMEDISSGQLTDEGDLTRDPADTDRPGDERRSREGPTGRSAHYVDLLSEGRRDGLRTAVLMKEILGRPVAYRSTGLAWEDERR